MDFYIIMPSETDVTPKAISNEIGWMDISGQGFFQFCGVALRSWKPMIALMKTFRFLPFKFLCHVK